MDNTLIFSIGQAQRKMKEGFQGQRSYSLPALLLQEVAAHPLCQGMYVTDIGFYPTARFHKRVRRSGSAQHILLYCVHGEGRYRVGDGNKHVLRANQWVVLPAHEAHMYGADEAMPWTIYWLHFAGAQAAAMYTYLQRGTGNEPLTIRPAEERFQLFETIFSHLSLSSAPDDLIQANACLPHFLATLLHTAVYSARQAESSGVISLSINYMREHLEQNLTVQELAEQAGLSTSHYSALFREQVGRPPIVFFNFLKVQKACHQLIYTSLRIKEIASQVGFEDAYYFSRVFTKVMGTSPRQFRNTDTA